MRIVELTLKNFRNYEQCHFVPCEGVTVLIGNNGQGKTNILEAVALTCTGRSHRTRQDKELVRWGSDIADVHIITERRDGRHDVQILMPTSGKRKIMVSKQEIGRSGELLGHVTGVLFSPEDLRTVKDGPAERRRFVDMALSQLKPAYYYAMQRFNRTLKQRNELLRAAAVNGSLLSTLEAWDEQLVQSALDLRKQRETYIQKLSDTAAFTHNDIADQKESLRISYTPSLESETFEGCMDALLASRDTDLRRLTTTLGPHRDDVTVLVNERDVRAFGSQGQQRTAALSMRLAELSVMHEEMGEWPVLMLDDVMSELDPGRRRHLLSHLKGVQTLVTCTDAADLAGAEAGMIVEIDNATLNAHA